MLFFKLISYNVFFGEFSVRGTVFKGRNSPRGNFPSHHRGEKNVFPTEMFFGRNENE